MEFLRLISFTKRFAILMTGISTLSVTNMALADNPYTGSTSVFVSYSNAAENTDLSDSPTVYISFDGSDHLVPFVMDTGSVGIIASADLFKPAKDAKNLGPGKEIYTSSGIIEEGTWWSATQNIYDANGNLLAISNVPVLRVTSRSCQKHALSCTPSKDPKGIAVMGIGFARETKVNPNGTPAYNAFLNLQKVLQNGVLQPLPSDWVNGYVVTPTGVDLGLTSVNTENAGWVKLMPWPQYSTSTLPEWMVATTTLSVNGVSDYGSILMDTGVTTGFLTPPSKSIQGKPVACPDAHSVDCAANGNVIDVYLPTQGNPVAFYTFTVGEVGNLMQPDGVHLEKSGKTFLNTSRHVLGGINFIYDNTNGYVGYIWNGLSGSNVGYVIPAVATSTTTVSSSLNQAAFGKKVKLTATVTGDEITPPSGTVTFIIDNVAQNPVYLDQTSKATLSVSNLAPLTHSITAKYSGDPTYIRSTASAITVRVKPPTCF